MNGFRGRALPHRYRTDTTPYEWSLLCNLLMLSKAVYGGLPKNPPAPLEDFIDSAVKTGADVSNGRDWCYGASRKIIQSGKPVPHLLVGRLSASRYDKAAVPVTTDHWLDKLTGIVKTHIDNFRAQRDRLVKQTMPPAKLFDHAFNADEREYLGAGIALNKLYSTVRGKLLHRKQGHERLTEADMTTIRRNLDAFLSRYDESEHGAILRGALVATYLSDEPSDTALWLLGEKTEQGHAPGMAQRTLQSLRETGILDEIGATANGGVIRYPGAVTSEPTFQRSIGINAVWFNWYCEQQRAKALPIPENLGDVPKAEMKAAKVQIAELAQAEFQNRLLTIRRTSYTSHKGEVVERMGAFTADGILLGLLTPDSVAQVTDGKLLTVRHVLAMDGNLRAVWD